nr:GNAT family N-acetyltransferase [uncultured Undibacterium sp.]
MSMQVRAYSSDDEALWDEFCINSLQSTLLHTRRFLSYHGTKFTDQSLLIVDDNKWLGILPAALMPNDPSCIISHPGASYGGIVHQGQLRGEAMIAALRACCTYFHSQGKQKLLYKAVPSFYHRMPAQDDLYAMFRLGARRYRCDLSSTIDLNNRANLNLRRRRSLNKAYKQNVVITTELLLLPVLWDVLMDNLAQKHDSTPVHSLAEMSILIDRFPKEIVPVFAMHEGKVVAGVILFITETCYHTQYIAASALGYQISALDAVFDFCVQLAQSDGRRWFDFGISNEQAGMFLNEGLYRFKTEFGGGGTVHEFFEILLNGELYVNS